MEFAGAALYWVPRRFPIMPLYSAFFPLDVVALTLAADRLTIRAPYWLFWRSWNVRYEDIESVEKRLTGLQFWFKDDTPVFFRTSHKDQIVDLLTAHGVIVRPVERLVG